MLPLKVDGRLHCSRSGGLEVWVPGCSDLDKFYIDVAGFKQILLMPLVQRLGRLNGEDGGLQSCRCEGLDA